MADKVHLIFSGFNQRAVIAFLRTLTKNNEPFAIIAKSKSDTILKTDYKTHVLSIRKIVELDLNDIINSINKVKYKINADEYIIAPSTEALNRFILKHKVKLTKLKCSTPLVDIQLYKLISDKYSFGELCLKNGIDVPATYHSFINAKIPFVAKPFHYFCSGGNTYSPILILTENDKTNFIKKHNPEDFFYQKFVTGNSLYLLYYFHRNGTIYKYSQENIVQQPNGKSIVAAKSSNFHLSSESLKYERMLKNINYHGFIMVEVKQKETTNYMIEANPRFWGPSQLFVDAKKNFFEAYLYDYGNFPKALEFSDNNHQFNYFWFGGILESYKNGEDPVFHKGDDKKFLFELAEWLQFDIYKRNDTIDIFKEEISKSWKK
jgi:predicted ATP-grasp superfamily ATP-dependent carboligase